MQIILIILSIVFYTHLIPILDRLTEYIQAIILTKKMKVNIKYTKYEKIVNDMNEHKSSSANLIGFQFNDADGEDFDDCEMPEDE